MTVIAQNEMLFGFGDGYDAIGIAKRLGWHVVSSWGLKGWDLGGWPYVSYHFREKDGRFEVAEYIEGDVTVHSFETEAERTALVDSRAFQWWKSRSEDWVEGLYEPLPEHRGPFSWERLEREKTDAAVR